MATVFFPFYLTLIATSVIFLSHFSSKILRLTFTRSLPVLATLLQLSYCNILRTIITVLFFYSTITHLPCGSQRTVWSFDASVPLFEFKFTMLFIICPFVFCHNTVLYKILIKVSLFQNVTKVISKLIQR